jgi:hypothetical protein
MMRRNDDGGAEAEERTIATVHGKAHYEEKLKAAFDAGIISKDDYVAKLHEHRGESELLVAAPVCTKLGAGGAIIPYNRYTALWEYAAGPFSSAKEAMAASHTVTSEENPDGRWKWNTKDAGGCKKHKRCNMHEDCNVLMRTNALCPGNVILEVLNLAHGVQEKLYRDKNSPFTVAQEKELLQSIEEGSRPAKMHGRHTMEAIKAGKRKNWNGGMEGERLEPMISVASHPGGCCCYSWDGRNSICI